MEPINKTKTGYFLGILSICLNTVLFAIKIWIGSLTHSIALIADAWHTLSDTFTSILMMIGLKISAQPKDDDHPFGHGRMELIISIIIGTLLGVVGFSFFKESIVLFRSHHSIRYTLPIISISIITLITKELLAQLSFHKGKKLNSPAMIADGWHHRSDALTSLLIVIGGFINPYIWWTDAFLGCLIAIILIQTAYSIIKKSAHTLIGCKPSAELLSQLKTIIQQYEPLARDPHHIHIHNYGDHTELTFHIYMDENMALSKAHTITTQIENEIRTKFNIEPTIHIEA